MLKTNIDPNDQEINYLEAGVGNLPLFFFFFLLLQFLCHSPHKAMLNKIKYD